MIGSRFTAWPLIPQILHGGDGTGSEAMSQKTRELALKIKAPKWPVLSVRIAALGLGAAASMLTRVAWVESGVASANDPWVPLELPQRSALPKMIDSGKITGENESIVESRKAATYRRGAEVRRGEWSFAHRGKQHSGKSPMLTNRAWGFSFPHAEKQIRRATRAKRRCKVAAYF